jgi:beta-lactamase superfamily II metal-dependent hydrolase
MRNTWLYLVATALLIPLSVAPVGQTPAQKTLDIYFIDTEGGQATLFVSPSGESLLWDTGTGDPRRQQADNIMRAVREAGVQQLDYVIVSHYHGDHVGNATELASRLPIRYWYDHGGYTVENQPGRNTGFLNWLPTRERSRVTVPKPGDKIPIAGVEVVFVSGSGNLLTSAVPGAPGAGTPNAFCREFTPKVMDATPENRESLGTVIRFGNFRMLNLGDLTWNQEHELVCPNNLLGTFDVYHTSRHGTDWAGAPSLVHATRARVAVMNNGARKGGTIDTWNIIHGLPNVDLWQLHYSVLVDKAHNPPEDRVANMDDLDHGYAFKMSVRPDGSFSMKNQRTGFTKEYPATKGAAPTAAAKSTAASN